MDWAKLVSDNFAAIAALVGVLVGAVGTYVVQSRLQERQRKWALDDQRRKWKRQQLMNVTQQMKKFASFASETSSELGVAFELGGTLSDERWETAMLT